VMARRSRCSDGETTVSEPVSAPPDATMLVVLPHRQIYGINIHSGCFYAVGTTRCVPSGFRQRTPSGWEGGAPWIHAGQHGRSDLGSAERSARRGRRHDIAPQVTTSGAGN
jgi:hypothetical protein